MKKIIALALSLMLLLGCVSALAEGKESVTMLGSFSIEYDQLPEGYTLEILRNTDLVFTAVINNTDNSKPFYVLTMEFSDEWDGVNTLADASEADIKAVKQDFYDVMELDEGALSFEDGQTSEGTPLLIAKSSDGSFGAVYTIYKSHEIEVDIFRSGDEPVSAEDVDRVVAFLTNVKFIPAK